MSDPTNEQLEEMVGDVLDIAVQGADCLYFLDGYDVITLDCDNNRALHGGNYETYDFVPWAAHREMFELDSENRVISIHPGVVSALQAVSSRDIMKYHSRFCGQTLLSAEQIIAIRDTIHQRMEEYAPTPDFRSAM